MRGLILKEFEVLIYQSNFPMSNNKYEHVTFIRGFVKPGFLHYNKERNHLVDANMVNIYSKDLTSASATSTAI